METPILSIVIPVFNEEISFPKTYKSIKECVKTNHEILMVYDFDEDTTVPVALELAKKDSSLRLVKNTLGRGPANALKMGFASTKGACTLVVMGDACDDLNGVDKMVELYKKGFDIVCGSRYMKGGRQIGGPFIKSLLSRMAGVSLYYLRGLPTHDVTNNYKLYDSNFLKSLKIESKTGFSIAMEITVRGFIAGKRISEIPTTWQVRTAGKSNFKTLEWLPNYLHWYFFAFRPKQKIS